MIVRKRVRKILNYLFPNRELGFQGEIGFWKTWLETKGQGWPGEFEYRTNPDSGVRGCYLSWIDQLEGELIEILDVGSGPLTAIGKKHPGKRIEITAVDPLANTYQALLKEIGITPLVFPQPCDGERLSDYFKDRRFDLVVAENSLDHTVDPLKVIQEMIEVCKPGGIVGLVHWIREGDNESYRGLHAWNFYLNQGELFIHGKKYRVNVNQQVKPFKFTSRVEDGVIYSHGKK
jgi:SAM-dependent methyltransferase